MIKYFCDMCGQQVTNNNSEEFTINDEKFLFCRKCGNFVAQKITELHKFIEDGPVYYINKKNKGKYNFLGIVTNCTNKDDGVAMVLYQKDDMIFVREYEEFLEKFDEVK